jgi:magnesium-transporting ATPase (P-type)
MALWPILACRHSGTLLAPSKMSQYGGMAPRALHPGRATTLDRAPGSNAVLDTDTDASAPLYTLQPEEVYRRLESSRNGLASDETQARLARYGRNVFQEVKGTPLILKFLANFYHFFALLLWAAAILAFFSGSPQLGIAIIAVIIINGVFSFYQEYKAEKATEALKRLLPAMQTVVRDGEEQRLAAADLVPGDVIVLA